ncbi:MAG: glycosyltransferase family 2 protein [Saprospiraceae bacterium]|nr:glycosyltransferase family 2 protein [Saprospiraceae bacterium]
MAGLSAVVITLNEEANIEACLRPLLEVAREVLVIDSHSSDRTRQIASELGARVIETDWKGYAQTKNFGNQQAHNDWILSIDADERLSPDLVQSLKQFKGAEKTVYELDRFTNYCGTWIKHSGWYPDWKVRIFDRRAVRWQGDYVHETLAIPPDFHRMKVSGKLLHYSYQNDADHWERMERYARLSAQEMFDKGKQITFIRPWTSGLARFFRTYLLKSGWRDGRQGWKISIRNAWLAHRKYSLLRALNRKTSV